MDSGFYRALGPHMIALVDTKKTWRTIPFKKSGLKSTRQLQVIYHEVRKMTLSANCLSKLCLNKHAIYVNECKVYQVSIKKVSTSIKDVRCQSGIISVLVYKA